MEFQAAQDTAKEQNLIELQPGKYLLATKNEFLKIAEVKTGLLVEKIGDSHKVVLVDNKLVIL